MHFVNRVPLMLTCSPTKSHNPIDRSTQEEASQRVVENFARGQGNADALVYHGTYKVQRTFESFLQMLVSHSICMNQIVRGSWNYIWLLCFVSCPEGKGYVQRNLIERPNTRNLKKKKKKVAYVLH